MTLERNASIEAFTLLEVLIAFVILALAMSLTLQTINMGTRSIFIADEKRAVLALAEELRVERLNDPALERIGTLEGRQGVLRWAMRLLAGAESVRDPQNSQGLVVLQIYSGAVSAKHYDFLFYRTALKER